MAGSLDTSDWKFYALIIILVIAAFSLLIVVVYPMLQHHPTSVPGGGEPVMQETNTFNPVTGGNAPVASGTISAPPGTVSRVSTAIPSSAPTLLPTQVPQTTVVNPVPFSLSVTPQTASARPGDKLTYTLNIGHGEGLTGPIRFSLAAKVLFFSQTYDLGTVDPPFPKSITYDFTVPGNLPSGVTVNGVITATGNGQTETQDIALNVL